jgi:hypothetical protein
MVNVQLFSSVTVGTLFFFLSFTATYTNVLNEPSDQTRRKISGCIALQQQELLGGA